MVATAPEPSRDSHLPRLSWVKWHENGRIFFLFSLLLQAFHFNYYFYAGGDIYYLIYIIKYVHNDLFSYLDLFLLPEARAFKFDTNAVVSVTFIISCRLY